MVPLVNPTHPSLEAWCRASPHTSAPPVKAGASHLSSSDSSSDSGCGWGQPCFRANHNTSAYPRASAHSMVHESDRQSCPRARFGTSRCLPQAAPRTTLVIPRAVVPPRPPQELQVPAPSGVSTTFARPTDSRAPATTPPGRVCRKPLQRRDEGSQDSKRWQNRITLYV